MTKLLAATATTLFLLSGAAFAQDSDGGTTALSATTETSPEGGSPTPFFTDNEGDWDPDVVSIFVDEEGMMREDDDFAARLEAATPDQIAVAGEICSEMQREEALISDTVQSRCKSVADLEM